jgi:hypothetical protein
MLPWVPEPRIAGGQEMTYGKSQGRHLKHFGQARADGSAPAFTKRATLAQNRASWRKPVTERLFGISRPHVRPLRCTTRVSPGDTQRLMAQRATEAVQRRAMSPAP